MKVDRVRLAQVSETSVMLYLGDVIDVALAPVIRRVSRRLQNECQSIRELTPSYTSILIEADIISAELEETVMSIAHQETSSHRKHDSTPPEKLIELPVYYHQDVGMDLDSVAESSGLSVDELVSIHSGKDYTVCAIGFAPGFAFLAEVDRRIATPRHRTPRAMVPAGSVGIAEQQTAVYPGDSPGGWQIIGNCPVPLFTPAEKPMSPFSIGDRVRFVPVDREGFIRKGGRV